MKKRKAISAKPAGNTSIGHQLGTPAVLATTFISYAFNLNFGSLVGGLAFRFRLYSRQGELNVATNEGVAPFGGADRA